MTTIIEGFRGRLEVAQRKREIIPALLRPPMLDDDELHIPLQLRFNEKLPLVISFFEYYRFLEQLVTLVLRDDIAQLVLVRVKMPSMIALPPILLDARVAIFHDVEVESLELSGHGTEHLCVDANFKLYSWSAGDNGFSVRWISPAGNRLGAPALAAIGAVVGTLPANFEYFANAGVAAEGACSS